VDRIAVGGMAEVFRAREPRQVGEPRVVVLKRMLPHIAVHPGARAMFEEEAGIGACVRHPNVVEVLGRGHEGGQPYLALEYVPGVDLWRLGRWLERQGATLGTSLALFIGCEFLAGLHAVHEARGPDGTPFDIVHRDVSPSNVLLSVHGDVKLGDFGIAQRRLREELGEDTFPQRAKGKLGYLSPEQVVGAPLDRRSDIFSAAVILAELLMGRPLFTGVSELAILLAIRDAQIQPFQEAAPSLPRGLVEAVTQALSPDAAQRTATAEVLRERLLAFQDEPLPALRRELGEIVASAMGAEEQPLETTPLHPMDLHAAQGSRRPHARIRPPGSEAVTGDLPPVEYQVRPSGGSVVGPLTYAKAVEAVSTGTFSPTDRVSVAGGAFRPLSEVPELARHIAAPSLPPSSPEQGAAGGEPPSEAQVSMEGGGFVAALGRSTLRRDTGMWLCQQGSVRKEVYVVAGVPEFVTSNLAGELLGEYLVTHGSISRGELDMALAVLPRFDGRLGDTLVALGLVEPVQLFRHIADQVREKLLDLFIWRAGTARFYPGVAPPERGFPLGIDPWRVLEEGMGRRIAEGLEATPTAGDRMLVPIDPPPDDLAVEALPPHLTQTLKGLREPSPRGPRAPSGGDSPRADLRGALLLVHLGALRLAERGSP
jgi:eukaryotic-like serine/threonine-protein kinase